LTDLFKYLKFQWQAKNLHAIHSPFLFQFIQKAIYKSSLPKKFKHCHIKQDQLLLSILYYFKSQSIFVNQTNEAIETILKSYRKLEPKALYYSEIYHEGIGQDFDLYILNQLETKTHGQEILNKISATKQKIVIIPQLRTSNIQLDFFKSFPKIEKGCVVLEFYGFAMIIYRPENSGEYFKIRKWGSFR